MSRMYIHRSAYIFVCTSRGRIMGFAIRTDVGNECGNADDDDGGAADHGYVYICVCTRN